MRILHVVTLLSPDGRYGGPVEVAEQLARASARRGDAVTIAAGAIGYRSAHPRRVDGVGYRLYRVIGGAARFRFSHLVAPGLWAWLWRHGRTADVVHLHLSRDLIMIVSALILLARVRMPGSPAVIVQTHGMVVPATGFLARVMDAAATRPILRSASAVLCLNDRESELVRAVEPSARVRVLRNGVRLPADAAEMSSREVLFLARINARKRPVEFVRMGAVLADRWPDVRFTLVGPDGGAGAEVREAIAAAGRPTISWEGAVRPADVHRRIAAASLYVLPAADEPFGMTIVEAMASSRPVVVARSGALADEIERSGAGVVFDDTAAGLVAAVEKLLADPGEALDMGARGRSLVEREFSIDVVAAELTAIYRAATDRPFSVLWVTNVAAPYRVPMWRSLASSCDLEVALLEDDERLSADTAANRGADWRRDRVAGVRIRSLRTLRLASGEGRFYTLTSVFPRLRQDAVLLGGWESPAYWQFLFVARLTGRRVVGFYESIARTHRHTRGLVASARRWYFRSLDAVVVPGVAARDALVAMGVSPSRILTGFNAVDVGEIHRLASAARPRATAEGHRFLYVGRLIGLKGVDLAIEAFTIARRPGDLLTIVGGGEERAALSELCRRRGVRDAVEFTGPIENADLPPVLAAHHTLVMPSRQDVWGLVTNEALAAGLHVVVSAVAGVAASVSNMRGVFVSAPDVEPLATAMRASADAWTGPIEQPEILAHDPVAFASVFARALDPHQRAVDETSVRTA
ncbi:glycosyltransferase [Planococcus sp. APC 4015]|nr:glycosyltransferase [Planococcus sp. APC 4015]